MINILILDDDFATVDAIVDAIQWKQLGIEGVYTAYHVAGAKKILSENEIHIVVSDIEMPQETGLDFLKWVRAEQRDCEFIFLTCHEDFSYATSAIAYDAAAYLTKPLQIDAMEMTLQKIISKMQRRQKLRKSSEYGAWMEKNLNLMKLDFWKQILEGELVGESRIRGEIESRHLGIEPEARYCFVYSRLSNVEADLEKYGKNVLEFILEEFHSEILTGQVENDSVIKLYQKHGLEYITVCKDREGLKEKCGELIGTCRKYLRGTVTCCVSEAMEITEFSAARQRMNQLFDYNIGSYGTVFLEEEAEAQTAGEMQVIDMEALSELVAKKERAGILRYLKSLFDELSSRRKLNVHSLYLMKQEVIQVVYADLMRQGIQATRLFYDETSIHMADCAMDSTVDMIRWVKYLLEKTFAYEEEIAKSATIVDKIQRYIREHYAEDIGRNEIAAEFFLTPEYLAKMYKKKTGVNLKDYINAYRIEQAKQMLKQEGTNISEVAGMVGFDNFSYFSTVFKKITGMTPKEYKKA